MSLAPATSNGTLVLDSEGLAKAVLRDTTVNEWLATAREENARVVTSAATLIEVVHPRIKMTALEWTLSRVNIAPVTESISRDAIRLLHQAGLHGRKCAIDAMVAATAHAAPPPVVVLTSDPGDLTRLCSEHIAVVKV
ncbi:PIN domain-containing protein [Spirillospora sp. NPDC029432]|uniref:PIN domain-containing protein n=1 Tax=Spirillospora sp. NPDC029432 TaxID=3154599 RepID=UPI0034541950